MHQHPPAILGRKVRFALAGCGRIAASHLAAIDRHADRAALVAVCDSDAAALAQACADLAQQAAATRAATGGVAGLRG